MQTERELSEQAVESGRQVGSSRIGLAAARFGWGQSIELGPWKGAQNSALAARLARVAKEERRSEERRRRLGRIKRHQLTEAKTMVAKSVRDG